MIDLMISKRLLHNSFLKHFVNIKIINITIKKKTPNHFPVQQCTIKYKWMLISKQVVYRSFLIHCAVTIFQSQHN